MEVAIILGFPVTTFECQEVTQEVSVRNKDSHTLAIIVLLQN